MDAVRAALAGAGAAVLQAPPGAGKTTVVPLRLLDEPWLAGGRIVVLEPRRLAARAAAERMADLVGEQVGATVGYRTRDERRVSRSTRVEVVTEGILTRRLQHDPTSPGVGLVVFDEIHERNLQSDLALALTLDARSVLRPDLRVLAMSATLDTGKVADLLGPEGRPAPVVLSAGREHTVEVRWRPASPRERLAGPRERLAGPRERLAEAAVAVIREALARDDGDVLVFLAGAADIRRVGERLRGSLGPHVDVRALAGSLPRADQEAALAPSPSGRRRVVLATDIAETSLTVQGVRVVVDTGQVRSPRFDPRSGLTRLHTGPVSRASADQRAGRAGRLGPGVAYRLWSESDHATRRPFAPPEITGVDLAGLALELAAWGTPVDQLAFLDAPPARALEEARVLLRDLGALDGADRITPVGRAMAELPVHPRLAHMIAAASERDLGSVACALAALAEERDVLRGRPEELPTDLAERVRLILDTRRHHPAEDGAALATVRWRSRELARRAGIGGEVPSADDLLACGAVVALAYPDRLAQARGGGRFRLRNGTGAGLPPGDALTAEAFLAVAELDTAGSGSGSASADHRIRLAAALDEGDLVRAVGDAVESVTTLQWDPARNDLRQRTERRVGALVLEAQDGPAPVGQATRAALVERARATELGVLRWTGSARALQARSAFAHAVAGGDWPDLSDAALIDTVAAWLEPLLAGAIGRADLERIDLVAALRGQLGHRRLGEIDRIAPTSVTVASGRAVRVDYSGDGPTIEAPVQELYGTTVHPAVGGGRVPLVVRLLSPAGRPVQVTADLPAFWTGSWSEVRREMAGRYPKHDWPQDPRTATAHRGPRRRVTRRR